MILWMAAACERDEPPPAPPPSCSVQPSPLADVQPWGTFVFEIGGLAPGVSDLTVTDDGAVWLAGEESQPDDPYAETNLGPTRVVRIDPSGAVDLSFGAAGMAVFPDNLHRGVRLAPAPGGAAYVARPVGGDMYSHNEQLSIVKLSPSGVLDAAFPEVRIDHGDGQEQIVALAPVADGGLLLAGSGPEHAYVRRYLADGSLDPGFGSAGEAVLDGLDCARTSACRDGAMAILEDGALVVAVPAFGAWKFDPCSQPDTSYGQGGHASGSGTSLGDLAAVAADGAVTLVAGQTIERLDASGQPDLLPTPWPGDRQLRKLEVDADGRPVLAGANPAVIWRLRKRGHLDETFAGDGFAGADQGRNSSYDALEIAGNGTIVAAGWSLDDDLTIVTALAP
jgi:uncharacterized delta-60 repeat protein